MQRSISVFMTWMMAIGLLAAGCVFGVQSGGSFGAEMIVPYFVIAIVCIVLGFTTGLVALGVALKHGADPGPGTATKPHRDPLEY